jgi:hypothetical protein
LQKISNPDAGDWNRGNRFIFFLLAVIGIYLRALNLIFDYMLTELCALLGTVGVVVILVLAIINAKKI